MTKSKIKGLGDAIKVVTEFVGVKQCEGCIRRQETLNRLFPFLKSEEITPLTEREMEILNDMDKSRVLKAEYLNEFFEAYNSRFVKNKAYYTEPCMCPGVVKAFKEKLDLLRKD